VEAKFKEEMQAHSARIEAAKRAAEEAARLAQEAASSQAESRLASLEQHAGLTAEPLEEEDEPSPAAKRFRTLNGEKVEIEPQLTEEEQTVLWSSISRRMVPAPNACSLLAQSWNGFDRAGDKLRGTKPVEAGIQKKHKDHLGKLSPTNFYGEFSAFILFGSTPGPASKVDLLKDAMGGDEWTLEFIGRIRHLKEADLLTLGIEYLFDPFAGLPTPRSNKVSAEVTALLCKHSVEAFQTFLHNKTVAEPAWLVLLHAKSPMLVARHVRDARVNGTKCDSNVFSATGTALEEASLGYFVNVPRVKLGPSGKMGEGPYLTTGGTPNPFFFKLIEYNDDHSGSLARAGCSVETMVNAGHAADAIDSYKDKDCQDAVKALLGLAAQTNNFHLFTSDTTFKQVLINAHQNRIGSKAGFTPIVSLHKHLIQLVVVLRRQNGRNDLQLDPMIAMPAAPSPPRTVLSPTRAAAAQAGVRRSPRSAAADS